MKSGYNALNSRRAWGAPSRFLQTGGISEEHMADANPVQAGAPAEHSERADGHRSAWILTGYGIFGLAMISLIAYSVAQYAAR